MGATTSPAVGAGAGSTWERYLGRSAGGLTLAAVVVGLGAGLGGVVFRELVFGVTRLVTGQEDYAATPGASLPWLPEIGPWFLLAAPVVGGLLYGPLVYRCAREARGHGVPEVMLAVAENDGRIRPRVAVVKSLASALTIGTGGSVGREGPIVQIGSAIGSGLGQWMRMPTSRLRLLVACGAGGGISATFNAPISGVFFALEIILLDFTMISFLVVVTASAVANIVAQAFEGSATFLVLPPFEVGSLAQYGLFAVVGVAGAIAGIAFTRALYGLEDLADRVWRGPEWLRPGAGGLLVGLVLVALPEMYGVGYPVLQNSVAERYALGFLLLLMLGKILATSLTLAVGGSGGIFAPSLFIGATAGTAMGLGFAALAPSVAGPAGVYGVVGMAAVLAGATRAPITAVVIVAEVTAEWSLIVPLMVAVAIATALSRLLSRETIYTMKLSRRGITLTPPAERDLPTWTRAPVGDVARPGDPFAGSAHARGVLRWVPAVAADAAVGAAAGHLDGPDGSDRSDGSGSPAIGVLSVDGTEVVGRLSVEDLAAVARTGTGPERCLVRLPRPADGWIPPPGFAAVSGPVDGADLLLTGPVDGLDGLAASLPAERDR